jgi:hypothetical protein
MQLARAKIVMLGWKFVFLCIFIVCIFFFPASFDTTPGVTIAFAQVEQDASGAIVPSPSANTPPEQTETVKKMDVIEYFTSGAFLISLTGVLLAFSGWILNSSIQYFVVDMGKYLGDTDSGMGAAVVQSWTIIRDLINLTFVFGLIYLAFLTIAKADTSKLKHGIANLLIGALLINFSLFFGKAIVDIANVTAIEIYDQMITIPGVQSSGSGQDLVEVGISGFFAQKLGIPATINPINLLNSEQGTAPPIDTKTGKFGFGFSIFISLIFLVTSFVFIAGGILIAIRFIVLALLLILSPVAFAFAFLPKIHTEEWSRMWWDKLIAQALFAPAYLLLLYIAMNIADANVLKNGTSVVDFFGGKAGDSIAALMNFILIIGFLAGSVIVAKKMGAYGSSTVVSWGKSARVYSQRAFLRGVGNATAGTVAVGGRRVFGRLGMNMAKDKNLLEKAAQGNIRARMQLSAAKKLEKASFDVRQVGGVGKTLGIGEGKTGGYKQILEDVQKRDEEYAKSFGTVDDDDPQVMMFKQQQKDAESKLASLKNQKELAKKEGNLAEMDKIDKEIHEQEEKVEKAKKAVDQEKNRRQVGSALTLAETERPEYKALEDELKENKKNLKALVSTLTKATDEKEIKMLKRNIKEHQDKIEKGEEEQAELVTKYRKESGRQTGYASYIESYSTGVAGIAWSALYGRNRQMNKKSSEHLRDVYKKKEKEKKEPKKADKPKADAKPAEEKHDDAHDDHGHH